MRRFRQPRATTPPPPGRCIFFSLSLLLHTLTSVGECMETISQVHVLRCASFCAGHRTSQVSLGTPRLGLFWSQESQRNNKTCHQFFFSPWQKSIYTKVKKSCWGNTHSSWQISVHHRPKCPIRKAAAWHESRESCPVSLHSPQSSP